MPCVWSVRATAAKAVSAVKSSRTCASSRMEVPTSSTLSVSTTCRCLPNGSAGTVLTSFCIQFPATQGRGTFQGLPDPRLALSNALMGFEDAIDGAARRHRERLRFLLGLPP
jgi:hypothetical protein